MQAMAFGVIPMLRQNPPSPPLQKGVGGIMESTAKISPELLVGAASCRDLKAIRTRHDIRAANHSHKKKSTSLLD
jgi:hypothetical protein